MKIIMYISVKKTDEEKCLRNRMHFNLIILSHARNARAELRNF